MSTSDTPTVRSDSFLTLHYRVATRDGEEWLSTFGLSPATLQMGSGQLAPCLEDCLIGLAEGERYAFDLEPEEAFGAVNPRLVERIARFALPPGTALAENTLVEFTTPGGRAFSGFLRALDATHGLFDFNHPLAGKPIRFEVEIIAIL
ncbi:MAG: FKBP-type peptidyl-prolyl cis-trans isomerase [Zoogloeaceae bacterium]|jgi:FKBP-type peptidyl-prolyl cis-trans isomerase SlpA|nr:FKBP-type peptidyl-prolyl cis-trans isomerase [Zoogloeaceae bacterium]